jgi:hypothetical protein
MDNLAAPAGGARASPIGRQPLIDGRVGRYQGWYLRSNALALARERRVG